MLPQPKVAYLTKYSFKSKKTDFHKEVNYENFHYYKQYLLQNFTVPCNYVFYSAQYKVEFSLVKQTIGPHVILLCDLGLVKRMYMPFQYMYVLNTSFHMLRHLVPCLLYTSRCV